MKKILFAAGGLCLPLSALGHPGEVFFFPCSGELQPAEDIRPFRGKVPKDATRRIQVNATSFTVTYLDVAADNDIGFDDPALGAGRRAVMDGVLAYLAGVITDGGNCDVEVRVSQTDGSGALAFAGTSYPMAAGFQPGRAFQHLTTGIDPNPATADILVTVDFGYPWNDTAGPVAWPDFDLYSVLLHEVTHGLGIASLSNGSGTSSTGFGGIFTSYDNLIHRVSDGQKAWDGAGTFQLLASELAGGANVLDFRGASAAAQYPGGGYPYIDTASPYAQGSNLSHFQTTVSPSETVMVRGIRQAEEKRTLTTFEASALKDLGYSIDPAALPVTLDGFWVE